MTPVRIAKIWNTDNNKCWCSHGATGSLTHRWWKCRECNHAGRHFGGFLQNWTYFSIPCDNCTPWYLPKWNENLHPHKLFTNIYNSLIHHYQNLDTTKMSFCMWWINKLWTNQTMEYYSALKINEGSSHEGTWRNLECTLSWWRDGAQTVFRAEKLLCDTIIVDKCPYTSVKTHRIYNTESEPHGNWALVNNNVWILVHNGSKVMWEMRGNEEVCGKSLYSPLNFSENRKLKKMKSKDNNPTV